VLVAGTHLGSFVGDVALRSFLLRLGRTAAPELLRDRRGLLPGVERQLRPLAPRTSRLFSWNSFSSSHVERHNVTHDQGRSGLQPGPLRSTTSGRGNNHGIFNGGIAPEQVSQLAHHGVPRYDLRPGNPRRGGTFWQRRSFTRGEPSRNFPPAGNGGVNQHMGPGSRFAGSTRVPARRVGH